MSQTSVSGKKDASSAPQPLGGAKMSLGAYAKLTSADAVFFEEGEQLNLRSDISVEKKGEEVIITAEFKTVEGKAEKGRRRISNAMLNQLAEKLETGHTGWHIGQKLQGEKGVYFDFSPIG